MTPTAAAETRKTWGTRLKAERENRRLTQGEVATAAGIDQASVSRAEAGGGSFGTYILLARHYGILLDTGTEEIPA